MPIQLKRSAVAGKVPTTAQLSLGELAVNTRDGRLFLKKDNGTEEIIEFVSSEILHGQVAYFAMTTAPTGWLKCNGAAISRTTFADLFAAIGTAWGVGNGSTTFNLPDLRGEFLRAWDDGRGVDLGRGFASPQSQQTQDHKHNMPMGFDGGAFYGWQDGSGNPIYGSTVPSNANITVLGANTAINTSLRVGFTAFMRDFTGETRPRNISLLACIKY